MAKKRRMSVLKRQREAKKRAREMRKAEKAALKRERRHGKPDGTPIASREELAELGIPGQGTPGPKIPTKDTETS